MKKENLNLNKFCPICKYTKISGNKKISSEDSALNNLFTLKKCDDCHHKFLSSFPTEEYLNELYKNDSKYVFGHELDEEYFKKKFKQEGFEKVKSFDKHWILNFIKTDQVGNYLEIGPGLCRLYKTFYKLKWHCEGLDLQPFIKAPGLKNNLNEINNNSKDVAVALDVLEHVVDPTKLLEEINIKLKINGKLFLSFPTSDSFKSKILNNRWGMVVPLAHLNFFSEKSIKIALHKANFKTIYVKNYSLGEPKRLAKNFLKLPLKLLKDIIFLDFKNFFLKISEFIISFLDIFYGDQMMVVAKKIK